MIVIGVDLGPKTHGLAVISTMLATARVTYVRHVSRATTRDVIGEIESYICSSALVALEVTEGPHGGMDQRAAISSGRAFAGANSEAIAIAWAAGASGVPVVQMVARDVRAKLGCPNTDAGVDVAIRMLVANWPKTANHARDAAAIAIIAAREHEWSQRLRAAGNGRSRQ